MKRRCFKQVVLFLFLSTVFGSLAKADFFPIPVIKKMKNVVTVAQSGGQYTDVKTAIDAISDATADNPYLVYIGPGVYTVTNQIQLKAYVTVMGSGRKATILRGSFSTYTPATSAVIVGADNATLTQLRVENTGASEYCIGIFNNAATLLDSVAATGTGGRYNYGVYNYFASPTLINVTASATGSTETNIGLRNYYSYPILRNCTLEGTTDGVRGGTVALSTVIGGSDGTTVCNSCVDANGAALDATCN